MSWNKTNVESVQHVRLLKSSIFVVQKAATPKNGVEFRQKFFVSVRYSLAMKYNNDCQRHDTSMKLTETDKQTGKRMDRTMY